MKAKRLIWMSLSALSIALIFCGCELLEPFLDPFLVYPSITSRLEDFFSDLNLEDRSDLYEHFHSDMRDRDAYKSDMLFVTGPFSYDYEPFTLADIEDSDIDKVSSGSYQVRTSFENANGEFDITLLVEESSVDWLIRKITLIVGGYTYEIKKLWLLGM